MRYILVSLLILSSASLSYAQQDQSFLIEKSRDYRQEGLRAQQINDIELAQQYYEKAIQLDPYFAEVYIDLGVIYEAKGLEQAAEQFYLKSLELNPDLLAAYTNLALLAEKRGDFKNARKYWRIRYDRGQKGEMWTQKAKEHLLALQAKVPEFERELLEKKVAELAVKVEQEKKEYRDKILEEARYHFAQGVSLFNQAKYMESQQELKRVLELAPENMDMIEKATDLIMKSEIIMMQDDARVSLNQGLKFFEQGNYLSTLQELRHAQELISQLSVIKTD